MQSLYERLTLAGRPRTDKEVAELVATLDREIVKGFKLAQMMTESYMLLDLDCKDLLCLERTLC